MSVSRDSQCTHDEYYWITDPLLILHLWLYSYQRLRIPATTSSSSSLERGKGKFHMGADTKVGTTDIEVGQWDFVGCFLLGYCSGHHLCFNFNFDYRLNFKTIKMEINLHSWRTHAFHASTLELRLIQSSLSKGITDSRFPNCGWVKLLVIWPLCVVCMKFVQVSMIRTIMIITDHLIDIIFTRSDMTLNHSWHLRSTIPPINHEYNSLRLVGSELIDIKYWGIQIIMFHFHFHSSYF